MIPAEPLLENLKLQPIVPYKGPTQASVAWTPVDQFADPSGVLVRLVSKPTREQEWIDPLQATYVLLDAGGTNRVIQAYNLRERTPPGSSTYGKGHSVVTSFASQELDGYSLAAGLLFLSEFANADKSNESWSAFFNGFAPTYTGFHFQYVKETLPIWAHPTGNPVKIFDGLGQMQCLNGWVFSATCFSSDLAWVVASAAWSFIRDRHHQYDLLFHYDRLIYRCIPIARCRRKPVSMCVTRQLTDYGDFGGMELSGMIIVAKPAVFKMLKMLRESTDLTTRIRMAYKDTCES
jgi:hypothetical protein